MDSGLSSGEKVSLPFTVNEVDLSNRFLLPFKRVETDEMGLTDDVLRLRKNLSTIVLGQPGSGKTSTITFLVKQMRFDNEEPVVIFDYKGDYARKGIYDPDDAIILHYHKSTRFWNIFQEAEGIGDYRTLSEAIFNQPISEEEAGDESRFFREGAEDLLMACLHFIDNSSEYHRPTNEDLVEFIVPNGPEDVPADRIRKLLLTSDNRVVRGAASELDPNNPETATNMYQTLRKRVARVFDGDFARNGTFSIREYMENPDGRTLVLDMSGSKQDVMAPMYRLFIDWSIKLGLIDTDRLCYFILDEFDEVGELKQIQRLLSTGRSQQSKAIIGVQSKSQIASIYGEMGSHVLLENCPQKILLRTDHDRTYVRRQIGKEKYQVGTQDYEVKEAEIETQDGDQWKSVWVDDLDVIEKERYPIEEQSIASFDRGEGIFTTEDGWVRARVPLWNELDEPAREYLSGKTPQLFND